MALIHYTFFSKVLGGQARVAVVLPSFPNGHDMAAMPAFYAPEKRYRTLYVLHGGSDGCTTYLRNTSIERYGQEGGFAVVMPEVKNSFYADMVHGDRYFTYLSEELPAEMERVFPLSAKQEDHFVVGNSMGSHGAIKWALRCPDFFEAAAGMSGVGDVEELGFFGPDRYKRDNSVRNAFGTLEDYRGSGNDLKLLAREYVQSGRKTPRLFSCCGTEDFTLEGVRLYAQFAESIGLPLEYEEGPGAHEWDFWDHWLRRIIPWMDIAPGYIPK